MSIQLFPCAAVNNVKSVVRIFLQQVLRNKREALIRERQYLSSLALSYNLETGTDNACPIGRKKKHCVYQWACAPLYARLFVFVCRAIAHNIMHVAQTSTGARFRETIQFAIVLTLQFVVFSQKQFSIMPVEIGNVGRKKIYLSAKRVLLFSGCQCRSPLATAIFGLSEGAMPSSPAVSATSNSSASVPS